MRYFIFCVQLCLTFGVLNTAAGAQEVMQSFTVDGRLFSDSAATTPLTDSDVNIVFQIMNANQNCILYEETVQHYNASIANGFFTLQVGSAVGTSKRSALDSANSMSKIFSNTTTTISGRTTGGSACSYNPNQGDQRYLRISVTPSYDNVTRVLSPNMSLDSVPMAIVAERAESLQGLGPSNLLQVNTSGSQVLSQSNLESIFTSSNYSALTSLLSGSSTVYSKPAVNGTTPLANIASPASPAAGQMWYDSGSIKFYNGSTTQTLGVSGAGISSLSAGTGLNVGAGPGGTITSSGTLNVDVGTTANKVLQLDGSAKIPAVDGSQLTNLPAPTAVSGNAITTGTIGGSTAVNTSGTINSGAITSTGVISGTSVSATGSVTGATGSFGSTSTGQLSLFDHATTNTNYITIKTPNTATLTADYVLTLPAALPGSAGQVLTSDTSGNLTWTSPSTGSVTSVSSGGAPIVIGGTASAPTVSVSSASTSAKGVVQLATGTDTAAGLVVQANDPRLTDSRAPSGTAGGDLSSTYPNPTVAKINGKAVTYTSITLGDVLKYDGTGWVNAALSSANLSNNSDLLKASNMPANCASGSTLTFSSPTGTWTCTSIPDATASSKGLMQVGTGLAVSSGTVSLASGVITTPGTYAKVTVDTYGRVTNGAALASSDITTALGYTPVNKAGDVMTGTLGLASYTNTTEATLIGGFAAADKGKTWFNSDIKQIRMWDGSQIVDVAAGPKPTSSEDGKSLRWNDTSKTWEYFTAGAAGSGIGTFNTLTANTQTLANGTSGTAPAWVSSGSTHTLNIPMASTSSVTAGLLSYSDYTAFNAKLGTASTFSGDVSGTSSTTSVDKIKGKSVVYTSIASGQLLKYDGTNWVNASLSSSDLSNDSNLLKASNMPASCSAGSTLTFTSPTGAWSCTAIPDATASSKGIMQVGTGLAVSSGTVGLASGVITTPGTYAKVTVDTYGRVTNGAALGSSDITTALGYTPVNKAGDVMTGTLGLASYTNTTEATLIGAFAASDKGKTWFNSDIKQMRMWDGSQVVDVAAAAAPTATEDGKSLKWNNTTKAWEYFSASASGTGVGTLNTLTANSQTLANGTSGTAPAWVSSGSTHTLNIPMASTSSVTAGLLSKTDYDAFAAKLGTSTSFSGDVSGTSSTTSVDKIKGKAVTTPTTSGQMLVYDGAGITPVVMSGDATMTAAGAMTLKNTGTAGTYYKVTTDSQGRVSSGSASLAASDIPNLDAGKITTGTIADARLPASATYWQAATGGINYAGGNVGVGTTTPGQKLSVAGTIESTTGGIKFPDGTVQTTSATSGANNTMVSNWPDFISCSGTTGTVNLFLSYVQPGGNAVYISGYTYSAANDNLYLVFTSAGAYSAAGNATSWPQANWYATCAGQTIAQLYSAGRAFNIAKGPAAQWLQNGSNAYYNAGSVGIGTNTPSANLNVVSTLPASGTVMPTSMRVQNSAMTATSGNDYPLGGFSTTQANSLSLNVRARQTASATGWGNTAMGISYDVDATAGAGGQLWFSGGNVGVGTPTPYDKLTVNGTTTVITTLNDHGLRVAADSANTHGILQFTNNAANAQWGSIVNTAAGNMVLNPNNNVGIGVAVPTQKLDVSGTVKASSLEIAQSSYVQIALNQCSGGACGSYHGLNTWYNVGAMGYSWSNGANTAPTMFSHNGAGTITVSKAGTYQITLYSMWMPTADCSYGEVVCPFINGTVTCPGVGNLAYQHAYAPAHWWKQNVHTFIYSLAAGTTVQWGYYTPFTLDNWAHDGYTAMQVLRIH